MHPNDAVREKNKKMTKKIAFQGALGAYSHEACNAARPDLEPLACKTFDQVIAAVNSGQAEYAMLPVENSTYGRVADIHRLLPESGLHIIDETFTRVRISMMANQGVSLSDVKVARAHLVLLPQAQKFLDEHNIRAETAVDSAGAAAELAASGAPCTPSLKWAALLGKSEVRGFLSLASLPPSCFLRFALPPPGSPSESSASECGLRLPSSSKMSSTRPGTC